MGLPRKQIPSSNAAPVAPPGGYYGNEGVQYPPVGYPPMSDSVNGAVYYPPVPPSAPMMMMPPPPPPGEIPIDQFGGYYGAAPIPSSGPLEQQHPTASPVAENEVQQGDKVDKVIDRFRGPLDAKRSCTDILCLILFLVVLIGFIVVTVAGFFMGNPLVLFYGHNSGSQLCGAGIYRSKTKVFTFDPIGCFAGDSYKSYLTDGCPSKSICVKECPDVQWYWKDYANDTTADVIDSKMGGLCHENVRRNETIENNVKAGHCPPYIFPSKAFLFRCEPSFLTSGVNGSIYNASKTYTDATGNYLKTDDAIKNLDAAHNSLPFIADIVNDLKKSWPHILVFTGMTMVVSFIWIVLMRFVGPCVIWFSILVFVVGAVLATIFTWIVYDGLNRGLDTVLGVVPTKELERMPKDGWLACAICATVLSLIFLILFCTLFNRIRLAAAVVTESSRAVSGSIAALFWPVFPFILQVIVHAMFVVGVICFFTVTSSGENSLDTKTVEKNVKAMWPVFVCLLFAWFWIINFIFALNYVTLAGSFSSWYWNHGTPDSEALQLLTSFWRAIRYHVGTMAFGALVIAIIQFIRAIVKFFEWQFSKLKNPIGVILLKCIQCCLWCIEKLLKFITKNAYIMVAIEGKHFCASARKAFKLIIENVLRIVVLDTISSILVFVSVFIIVAGFGVFALFVFKPSLVGWSLPSEVVPDVKYFLTPLIVEVIASLLAALCFFSVYKMAIDTIFLNLMYDLKYNDGTSEKPYRAKKSLLNVVGRKNKKEKKDVE